MKAAILAGGLGTRLRPLTYTTPKPLLPVLNVPMVRRLIERVPPEVDGVVLAVNYLADRIRAYLHAEPPPVPVEVVVEEEPLGTGGAVKNLEGRLGGERFLVMNGDVVCDADLRAMVAAHRASGAVGTIHVWPVEDPSRYGVVRADPSGRIHEFVEKPPAGRAPSNLINAGTYVLDHAVLDRIPAGRPVSMEREVFPALARDGLFAFQGGSFWVDAGKPLDYLEAHRLLLERRGDGLAATGAAGVALVPPVLAPATATVAAGARLGPNVCLGAGVRVGPGAHLSNTVVLDRATVGEGASLEYAVVGFGASVGAHARLSRGTVVADGAKVEAGRTTGEFEAVGGPGPGGEGGSSGFGQGFG